MVLVAIVDSVVAAGAVAVVVIGAVAVVVRVIAIVLSLSATSFQLTVDDFFRRCSAVSSAVWRFFCRLVPSLLSFVLSLPVN